MAEPEMENPIRVRFAPSPTGHLHLGGARTALYNWLYARNLGGEFFLRIEDTDRERSSDEMANQIQSNLKWLGLDWDGQVFYQSRRLDIYREKAQKLLEEEKVFQCFCERTDQDARNPSKCDCYLMTVNEIEERIQTGKSPALRFWVPTGSTCFEDLVYGTIEVDNSEIDNFIVLRDDGTPTYHLAVVVDDAWMQISHVIRGEDHISNTSKQILLYYAFDQEPPQFAHLPLILGPDKKRLSKRHGASSVAEYSRSGILPNALINYLALLGWSPGDDKEIMALDELVGLFSLERVARKSAVFDSVKLEWVNSEHIKKYETEELTDLVMPYLVNAGLVKEEELTEKRSYIRSVVELFKPRMKTLKDLSRYGKYFFQDPEKYDGSALKKYWQPETKEHLSNFSKDLVNVDEFRSGPLEEVLRKSAVDIGVQAAKLIHPVRIVLTGYSVSPGLFDMMEILGKEAVVRRIENGITSI